METITNRFLKPGKLVADLFSGSSSTANVYLALPWNRRFVGCKVDPECFAPNPEALAKSYAR